jgi:thiol:disulfide interchange protein DsbD
MGNGLPRKLNVLLMFKSFAFSARRPLDAVLMLVSCFALLLCSISPGHAADDFLDPAVAFKFSASEKPGEIDVRYKVADGYYMYRERFAFAVKNGAATLGEPQLPAGKVHFDQTFNKDVETYRGELVIRIPVKQASGPFDIAVTSQGCADQGICYPPMERVYRVSGAALQAASASGQTPTVSASDVPWYERATNADYAQSLLESGGFFAIVGLYFVAGVVLSLLPCSYPMIPILSAIIIGEGARVTRSRGFGLSVAYVFGMALVYTALGVLAAMIGQSLGAWLQNPWVLGAFGVLLAVFALTLIAGVDIALPARWQNSVNEASQKRSGGKVAAVVVMGALSALVVGACMTAPLFAVLAFIAHTGNALLGGVALFSMGVGLGVPLLIIGLGAGTLLPRAGNWMDGVKVFFGVVLLAAALWIVWPVLSAVAQMAGGVVAACSGCGVGTVHIGRCRGVDLAQAGSWIRRCARYLGRYAARWTRGGIHGSASATGRICCAHRLQRQCTAISAWRDVRTGKVIGGAGPGAQGRQSAGHAGFLCRLVRVVQGNGASHVQRSAGTCASRAT